MKIIYIYIYVSSGPQSLIFAIDPRNYRSHDAELGDSFRLVPLRRRRSSPALSAFLAIAHQRLLRLQRPQAKATGWTFLYSTGKFAEIHHRSNWDLGQPLEGPYGLDRFCESRLV